MKKSIHNKHADIVIKQETPFNAGPPLKRLSECAVTPTDLFFVRSHGDVPTVNMDSYRLTINGRVSQPLSLSFAQLKNDFKRAEVSATLMCAGNRREELTAMKPIPNELPWGAEAISHAAWAGVRLGDVLTAAGAESEAGFPLHVEFGGLDETERLYKRFKFGGSIPLTKALSGEVILAYEMNGKPLPPMHGFPLRMIVPGYIGARSVKWLEKITVQAEPSQNYFQRHAYRLFAPDVTAESVNWDDGLMLGELNVNAVICSHVENEQAASGVITVHGYSMAGGGREVARVDVSCDGGETWIQAELNHAASSWAWTLWKVQFDLKPGKFQLVVRAVDSAGNVQPKDMEQVWNFKGYMNNAWHRININVQD